MGAELWRRSKTSYQLGSPSTGLESGRAQSIKRPVVWVQRGMARVVEPWSRKDQKGPNGGGLEEPGGGFGNVLPRLGLRDPSSSDWTPTLR